MFSGAVIFLSVVSIGTVFLCLHCKIQDDDVESMLKGMRNSLPTPLTGKAEDFDDIECILGGNDVDDNGYGHHVHHVYIIFDTLSANGWKRDSHDSDQYHASPKKLLAKTTMMMVHTYTDHVLYKCSYSWMGLLFE